MKAGRPQVAAIAFAVAATGLTGAGVAYARLRDKPPDLPAQPTMTYTQDARGVHVTLHNPNDHWTLRNQHLEIWLFADVGAPITNYGPDDDSHDYWNPKRTMHCCLIPYLPPGGDYVFNLFAIRDIHVGGIRIIPRNGEGWTRDREP